jgi:hypothetical protein
MGKIIPTSERIVDADIYDAVIVSVEEPEEEGPFGPSYVWKFAVPFEGENLEIVGFSSQSHSTKGKLVKWARGALGDGVLTGFHTKDLAGVKVRIQVEPGKNKDGDDKNKVVSVLPAKKTTAEKNLENTEENFADIEV